MNGVEQKYFKELEGELRKLIEALVVSTVAQTMAQIQRTHGDAISQRQAEREFGRAWLHAHIATEGRKIYTHGPSNIKTGAKNRKRTFSRAQLAEIRAREQDDIQYARYIVKFHAMHEGYDNYDCLPVGLRELYLDDKQRRLDRQRRQLELEKAAGGRIRPSRAEKRAIKEQQLKGGAA